MVFRNLLGFTTVIAVFGAANEGQAAKNCKKIADGIEKTVKFVNDKFLSKLKLQGTTRLGPATFSANSQPPKVRATATVARDKIDVILDFTKGTADATATALGLSARAHLEYPATNPKRETFSIPCVDLNCDKFFAAKIGKKTILAHLKDIINHFVSTLPKKLEERNSGFSVGLKWPELKTLSYNNRTNIVTVESTRWGLTSIDYTVTAKKTGNSDIDSFLEKAKKAGDFSEEASKVHLNLAANWGPIKVEIPCALKEKHTKPDDDGDKEEPAVKCNSFAPGFLEFDFNKDNVDARKNATELSGLERMVKSLEPGNTVQLIAHTDCVGNFIYNVDLSERRARAVMNWLATKTRARAVASSAVYETRAFTVPRIRKCGGIAMNSKCSQFDRKTDDPCLAENRRVQLFSKCNDTLPRGFDGSHGHKAYVNVRETKLWGLFGTEQISKHAKCTPVLVRYGLIAIDANKASGGNWGRVEVGGRVGYMKTGDFKLGDPASCRR